jgi:hypothetical protein
MGRFNHAVGAVLRSSLGLAAGLLVFAVGASTAGADEQSDRKVYPGNLCVPQSPRFAERVSYGFTGVSNYDGNQSFSCPAINDGITVGWNSAMVQVRGRGVRCVGVASPWGGLAAFVTAARTSNSSGLSTLVLSNNLMEETDLGSTNNPLSSVWAHYEISCTLPTATGITRYYIREK